MLRAVGLTFLILLAPACGTPADEVPSGVDVEVVADESTYPGPGGPTVGSIIRDQQEASEVWDAVGFADSPPFLGDRVLVVVAGGESGTCPWQQPQVGVEDAVVTVDLGDPAEEACTDDWRPRAFALLAPAPDIPEDAALEVVWWGRAERPEPIDRDAEPLGGPGNL